MGDAIPRPLEGTPREPMEMMDVAICSWTAVQASKILLNSILARVLPPYVRELCDGESLAKRALSLGGVDPVVSLVPCKSMQNVPERVKRPGGGGQRI